MSIIIIVVEKEEESPAPDISRYEDNEDEIYFYK